MAVMAGPEEDFDSKWQTTETHTPENMVAVYRELFFAGLPTSPRSLPEAAVHELFCEFGATTHLFYNGDVGAGTVTFADGQSAERCFITANGSCLPGGSLLVIEFAQWLPFVNGVLKKKLPGAEKLPRLLLRTLPKDRHNTYMEGTRPDVLQQWVDHAEKQLSPQLQRVLRVEPFSPVTFGPEVDEDELRVTVNYLLYRYHDIRGVKQKAYNALKRSQGSFAVLVNLLDASHIDTLGAPIESAASLEPPGAFDVAVYLLSAVKMPLVFLLVLAGFLLILTKYDSS